MRRARLLHLSAIVTISSSMTALPAAAQSPTLTPPALAKRVNDTYAQARSYRDEGTVTSELFKGKERQALTQSFQTAFVRPNHFRFESKDTADLGGIEQKYIIWTTKGADDSMRWWSLKSTEEHGRLDLWLAGGRSITGGASLAVPLLLLPSLAHTPLITDLKSLHTLPNEKVDGTPCLVLEGVREETRDTITIWVGQSDFLIRQIRRSGANADFRSVVTLTYHPQLNVAISVDQFQLQPPGK